MSKAPWYKRFAADFVSDPYVQAMTAEQYGWYSAALDMMWIHTPQGCLPNDEQLLSKMIGRCEHMHFHAHAKIVLDRFKVSEDGQYIYHPKLVEQVDHIAEVSEKRAEAGKKGAENRGLITTKKASNSSANVQQLPTDSDSESEPDIKSKVGEFNFIELAKMITLEIHVGGSPTLLRTIADALQAWCSDTGNPPPAGFTFLSGQARDFLKIQNKAFGLQTFFAEAKYNDPPETWEKRGNGTKSRNRIEEAIEAIRGTDDADFDAMAARQTESESLPRRTEAHLPGGRAQEIRAGRDPLH